MKQEKRNKQLIVSLGILSVAAVLLYFFNPAQRKTTNVDKSLFKVEDQINIDEVILLQKNGEVVLKFQNNNWRVGEYEADRQLIKVFFAAILQAEPKRKVTGPFGDSIRSVIASSGVLATLKEDGQIRKEFYVLGEATSSQTFYQLRDDDAIYVVTIPGYRVYLASIFELTTNDWRDKRLFNFNWQNFKRLEVSRLVQPADNFSMSFQNGLFGVDGLTQGDTAKINTYLDVISLMKADRILTADERKDYDSVELKPELSIVVMDIADRHYTLEVFRGHGVILGQWNATEWVVLNPQLLAEINRKRNYFVPRSEQ